MSTLRELQENFQAYIMNDDEKIVAQLTDFESMSSKQRADVYKNAYSLRLLEVMGKDFPGLKQFMGEEEFNKMGRKYIASYPSNHFNIVMFDRHLPNFLRTYEFVDSIHIELADFEWEQGQVLIAPDAPQLTVQHLASVVPDDWAYMTLSFHPSVRILSLFTNAPVIWRAQYEKVDIPPVIINDTAKAWMVWRFNLRSFFVSLNEAQVWMYHAIDRRMNFADICDGLTEFLPEQEVGQFAAFTLRDWFLEGVISEIQIENHS